MFMNERQKMLSGQVYDPQDAELVADRIAAERWMARYNATLGYPSEMRRDLLIERLAFVGAGVEIRPPFHCDYGYNIELGRGVVIETGVIIADVCQVEIGDNARIGPGVRILTSEPPADASQRASGAAAGRPIAIGRDVWIGGGAVILPGVVLIDGATVAAGVVVSPSANIDGPVTAPRPTASVRD